MLKKIKVLVVDDSAFMRKVISETLNQDPRIHVIATARNGADALMKRKELKPDVITLDVEMPIMDGLETLKKLMEEDPCPVVMISSTTKEGTTNTLLAMEYGAVDFITKPSGAISLDMDKLGDEMAQKVIQASKARVLKHKRRIEQPKRLNYPLKNSGKRKIIAIGTSTGGPKALKEVITELPASINAPILIVQHMPAHFTRSLAERLDSISNIHVKEARDGERIENGTAYIAPGGFHMGVREVDQTLYIRTHLEEPKRGHRPSVDKLYDSLADVSHIETIAVIMTGMGADGAEGLLSLKKTNQCYALAEAEESCVVFGMPKAAIKTKLVDEIVHVEEIGKRLTMIVT